MVSERHELGDGCTISESTYPLTPSSMMVVTQPTIITGTRRNGRGECDKSVVYQAFLDGGLA